MNRVVITQAEMDASFREAQTIRAAALDAQGKYADAAQVRQRKPGRVVQDYDHPMFPFIAINF